MQVQPNHASLTGDPAAKVSFQPDIAGAPGSNAITSSESDSFDGGAARSRERDPERPGFWERMRRGVVTFVSGHWAMSEAMSIGFPAVLAGGAVFGVASLLGLATGWALAPAITVAVSIAAFRTLLLAFDAL